MAPFHRHFVNLEAQKNIILILKVRNEDPDEVKNR